MSNFYDRERVYKYGDDLVVCRLCGNKYVRIGTHVVQFHKYESSREYYKQFGLSRKEGTSVSYREAMNETTKSNGTMSNLEKGIAHRFKKGDERIEVLKEFLKNRRDNHLKTIGEDKGL